MSTNCMFPYIKYQKNKSHLSWGQTHGEEFKTPIYELAQIRKELMLAKNHRLKSKISELDLDLFEI